MTSAPARGSRPIRIGNCSGFYGDRASAMADMARAGGIDVLTGDYLAEVTMLILGKARAKDPTTGYAGTFLRHLDAALEHLVGNGIRLVVNAGGLNPAGLADTTRDLIAAPRPPPARLPHPRRRRLLSPRRSAARRPLAATPGQRCTADILAAPAPDRQRLPGRVRHRPRPGQRRRHRHHRPGRRRLGGPRSRRLVVELDPPRLRRARRRAHRRTRHRMRATSHRRQLLRVRHHRRPGAPGVPDRRNRRRRFLSDHQKPGHRRRRHPRHRHRPTALRDR